MRLTSLALLSLALGLPSVAAAAPVNGGLTRDGEFAYREPAAAVDNRLLVLMIVDSRADDPDGDVSRTTDFWQRVVWGTSPSNPTLREPNVRSYMETESSGRIKYTDMWTIRFRNTKLWSDETTIPEGDRFFAELLRQRGNDLARYDEDQDGVIEDTEVNFIALRAHDAGGATRKSTASLASAPVSINANIAHVQDQTSIANFAHELMHAATGSYDLYGAGTAHCSDLSIMTACTASVNPSYEFIPRLDPFHRLKFGFQKARVYDLSIAQSIEPTAGGMTILYDSRRGTGEYFVLVSMNSSELPEELDRSVIESEHFFIWHVVDANQNGNPDDVPALAEQTNSTSNDQAVWVMATNDCGGQTIDANEAYSRGHVHGAQPAGVAGAEAALDDGTIGIRWLDGSWASVLLTKNRRTFSWKAATKPMECIAAGFPDASPATRTGKVVAVADLGGDGFDDVIVGAPDALNGAGALFIYRGTASGLSAPTALLQSNLNVGMDEAGDKFGASLAVGDFNCDGNKDVAIGVPGEAPGSDPASGSVVVLTSTGAYGITQESIGIGQNEAGDRFGAALAATVPDDSGCSYLAIGAPGEAPGAGVASGIVYTLYAKTGKADAALPSAFGVTPQVGERFGETLTYAQLDAGDQIPDLLIGAPGRDSGSGAVYFAASSGSFNVIQGSRFGASGFGTAIATGALNSKFAGEELVVGAPQSANNSGRAFVLRKDTASNNYVALDTLFQRGGAVPEAGDLFGSSVHVWKYSADRAPWVAVGSPGELFGTTKRGLVTVFAQSPEENFFQYEVLRHIDVLALDANGGVSLGTSLATGNVNGDANNHRELVIGDPDSGPGAKGRIFLVTRFAR